ncbi:MAG: DnaD domain protein [Alicyclobacillus sp.]|nr:DnaD domain protein [Alicyclobacillus sp.]
MKPSDREQLNADFLSRPLVSVPLVWLERYASLGLSSDAFVLLLHIYALKQTAGIEFMSPPELAQRCGLSVHAVTEVLGRLVEDGFLRIGERVDAAGTHSNYFDLAPLWVRLRGGDPRANPAREWRVDPITLFEEELGRPLSALECEQLRQWLEVDRMPEWLVVEALKEAVLANKISLKYIDRILYDWQRHRIRSRQDLETYRQSYRERTQAREEAAATARPGRKSARKNTPRTDSGQRDERYAAFYELFPDA